MTVQETIVARLLRNYYNEAMDINGQLDDEEMSLAQSERALIHLDETYAEKIVEALK